MNAIKTLVIARPDRVGDVILSSSCLSAVRRQFADATVHWMVAERMHSLFFAHPLVDGLMTPGEGNFWRRVIGLRRAFLELKPDAVALLQPDRAIEVAGWLAGVRVRTGFVRSRSWPNFLTHPVPYRKSEGMKHEAEYNFEVLSQLGVPKPTAVQPWLSPDPRAHERLAVRLGANATEIACCAVLHLAAHGTKPRVPLSVFAELARWLNRERGLRLILIGTETDPPAEQLRELAGLAEADLIDLRGPTELAESAWLLKSAAFFAARDTGPAHLAAAQGCPTLVFFMDPRPLMAPRRWTPLGPCVEVLTRGPNGFDGRVIEAAERLLARGRVG